MHKLTDENLSLDWVLIDYEHDNRNSELREYIKNTREQINNWDSFNIRRFITSKMLLGDYLYEMCDMYNDRFDLTQAFQIVAYEDNEIVGTALIAINSNDIKRTLNTFSLPNNLKILYLIVNPQYNNCGIATRMIKSIINNQKFFSYNTRTEGISVEIHNDNIASQKAFLKNKFKVYIPSHINENFSVYFFRDREEFTQDIN